MSCFKITHKTALLAAAAALALTAFQAGWPGARRACATELGNPQLNTLQGLRDSLLSFFPPSKGEVISEKDGLITASFANTTDLKTGIRLQVFRKGAIFYHPVTHKPLGRIEEPVGVAEVTGKDTKQAQLKLVSGQAEAGDVLRITSNKIRLLFYQLKNVSWGLSEEYFELLRKSGRFELLTTGQDDPSKAMSEAKRLQAEAVLVLSQSHESGQVFLNQDVKWASDGKILLTSGSLISRDLYKEYTMGDKLFAPKDDTAVTFRAPYSTDIIGTADPAGDCEHLLMLVTSHSVSAYNISDAALAPALGGAEIDVRDDIVRLDSGKLGSNPKDSIFLALKNGDDLSSAIYTYSRSSGKFVRIWKGKDIAVRPFEGKLYAQKFITGNGFSGPVTAAVLNGGKLTLVKNDSLKLPAGVGIFDFSLMRYSGKTYVVAYNKDGHVSFYNDSGSQLWKSPKDFGGFLNTYKRESFLPGMGRGSWSIKDKIIVLGGDAVVIKRDPIAGMAKGLGYKNSRITVLRWNGLTAQNLAFGKKISGTVLDMAVTKNKLIVLDKPMLGMKFANILQGDNPFTEAIFVYPLEGE
ncbi:MAG: hypothetical protein M0018_09180 [Nitrospiraceae bacterium]|nr:hypothetical protein [Nitrospiraceae bacterium]